MSRNKSIAIVISTITNPFLVLICTLLISHLTLIKAEPKQALIFLVTNLTLPTIFYLILLFQTKRNILHFQSINRVQRFTIFLSTIFSSLTSTILFSFTNQNKEWVYLSMIICVLFSIYYMINRYIDKLSLHAGVFAFSMIYLSDKINLVFISFLAGLIIIFWARIKLHQHTWFQLLLGSAIGMFIGILSWTY